MPNWFKCYWIPGLWALIILVLCGLPGEDLPNIDIWDVNIEDKLAHVFVFALLAMLTVWAGYRASKALRLGTGHLSTIVAIVIVYGGLTEILQGSIFTSRTASIVDFVADSIGAILGTVFANRLFLTRTV